MENFIVKKVMRLWCENKLQLLIKRIFKNFWVFLFVNLVWLETSQNSCSYSWSGLKSQNSRMFVAERKKGLKNSFLLTPHSILRAHMSNQDKAALQSMLLLPQNTWKMRNWKLLSKQWKGRNSYVLVFKSNIFGQHESSGKKGRRSSSHSLIMCICCEFGEFPPLSISWSNKTQLIVSRGSRFALF